MKSAKPKKHKPGRKPIPENERKKCLTFTLSHQAYEWAHENKEAATQALEELAKKS